MLCIAAALRYLVFCARTHVEVHGILKKNEPPFVMLANNTLFFLSDFALCCVNASRRKHRLKISNYILG